MRDARDVALSNIRMGWSGNCYTGVARWIEAEQLWSALTDKLPASAAHEVRFEDLVTDPRAVLEGTCSCIGIPYSPSILDYHRDTTYDPPNRAGVQRWRKTASEMDIPLVEARAGDLLAARGYDHSGLPPLILTPQMLRKLHRQDRWFRRLHRLKRYGLRLWLADVVSSRTGPWGWHRRVRLRMNEIDRLHLK